MEYELSTRWQVALKPFYKHNIDLEILFCQSSELMYV